MFCGLYHLHYETIDPGLVSPTKIFNFCRARNGYDKCFIIALCSFYLGCAVRRRMLIALCKKIPHPGPRANECLRGWTLGDFYQNWVSVHDSLGSAHVLQYALPNTGRLVLEHCCERVHLLHFNVSHSNVDVMVSL